MNVINEDRWGCFKSKVKEFCDYIEYNKKYFIVPFLLVLFIISCYTKDDNDMYFLYENGREILTNGIPYYDWMSMHDGLHIVLQQWVVSVIDFVIWDNFGILGVQFYITCVLFVLSCSFFYLSYLKTKNIFLSFLIVLLPLGIIALYTGNARPQLWSLMIVTWTLITFEIYNKTNNNKILLLMPLFSLMMANFHATFWTALIAVQLAYFTYFAIRNKSKKNILFFAILFLVSFGIGFINPYGYMAIFSPYFTIGHKGYNKITELMPPDITSFIWGYLIMFFVFIISLFLRFKNNKSSLFIIDTILMLCVFIYSTFVFRTIIFYLLFVVVCISDLWLVKNSSKINITDKDKKKMKIELGIFSLLLIIMAGFQFNTSSEEFFERRGILEPMQEIVDYLEENEEDIEGKTVFSTEMGFGNLAYGQIGTRAFTDGRFENYIIQFNKKFDYLDEIIGLTESGSKEEMKNKINDFCDKYKFDYLVLGDKTTINLLFDNEDYELIHYQSGRPSFENFYLYKRVNN